jgi:hypothetical protein
VGAWALLRIWRARQGLSSQKGTMSDVENLIVSVYVESICFQYSPNTLHSYLLNPYLLLPSLALSTSTFENALTLLALMFASEGTSYRLCPIWLTRIPNPRQSIFCSPRYRIRSSPHSLLYPSTSSNSHGPRVLSCLSPRFSASFPW